jgi:hypothetical protein
LSVLAAAPLWSCEFSPSIWRVYTNQRTRRVTRITCCVTCRSHIVPHYEGVPFITSVLRVPSVSVVWCKIFVHWIWHGRVMYPKYFHLRIVGKVYRQCLGLVWMITDAFVLLAVRRIQDNLLHVYSSKARLCLLSAFLSGQLP